jgi:hypothetical protein
MGNSLPIARAYLRGPAAAVWLFLLICLLVQASVEDLARRQGAILGGILSRKAYLAMFAYFNACVLGVLLRDNIAHPWASVLPHYRQKHLQVTALIALVFLGIPMFSMEFVRTSGIAPTSIALIFLTCLAAGLWTLHHPVLGFLAFPFLVFVFAPASASPGLAAFLAGTSPVTSTILFVISLLALWVLAWRLLVLHEEMLDYAFARIWGDFLRGRGQVFQGQAKAIADYLAALPADRRAPLRNIDPLTNPFSNLRQVDNLSGYSARSLWQRLQLWRLGTAPTRTSVSVAKLILMSLIIIPPMVFIPPLAGVENPPGAVVVIFSVQVMTNPFYVWLFWFKRRLCLGYESLRPRTRQEFVRELGLAFLWDVLQCWLGGVLFMGIAAAIWAPELLQANSIILFVVCTAVGQLCLYAMAIWPLKRGVMTSVACALGAFMAIALWMLGTMHGGLGVEVNLVIALILTVASVATILLAYRRWCQADLD